MTVLVTGGAGYIGSHMAHELLAHNENIVVLDNLSTGFRFLIPNNVTFIKGEIDDIQLVSEIVKEYNINSVIHFAGSIVVPESLENPLKYYYNNTAKSRTLISTAIENKIKHFIFSSTAAVYGMPDTSPVKEDIYLNPISPYGSSKMMTEIMLKDATYAHDFNFVALRYFNVSGADSKGRTGQATQDATHLIKLCCKTALGQRNTLSVFGTDYPTTDGTCIRDYIHVSDLVEAHKKALDYLREGGQSQIMNCGYGKGYSVLEVIEAVKDVSGIDFKVELTDRRQGDPAALIADISLITETLSWKPQYDDLKTIVKHALDWEKKLKNLPRKGV